MSYAAFTAAAPADPAALLPALSATNTLRGGPNLALAPAQPARGLDPRDAHTRAGRPCRSPAIDGKLRWRMHGVRSPGPRTPDSPPQQRPRGRIRVRDARTIHGNDGANASADNRRRLTLLRVSRVDIGLDRHQAHLSPTPSANRPLQGPPTPGPIAPFKPFRTDPLNREPTAKTATPPFKPFRTDPLNREPTAKPVTVPFKPFRTDPLNREPSANPGPTAPRVSASNAFSAAANAQPARALHPIAP